MPDVLRILSLRLRWIVRCILVTCVLALAPAAQPQVADAVSQTWLRTLFVPEHGVNARVIRDIAAAGRTDFVPVLIELLRFRVVQQPAIVEALHTLTAQRLGDDWLQWVEWLGRQSIVPPSGFAGWKGDLLALIDPSFRDFIFDAVPTRIKLEEVVWGGVRKDGIPALVNPSFIAAPDATYLEGHELVFGIVLNGEARAYPHRILDWHEMANDVVGGVPMALTY